MNVIVILNEGYEFTYGYAPEHHAEVNLFYAQALADGEIAGYTIKR